MRHQCKIKPEKCPSCGGKKIADILWGMPDFSPELEDDMEKGRIVLGGCVVTGDDPEWECTACQTRIYREKEEK